MPSRRAFYFVTSVVCLLLSAGLYASATANYPPPWNNPRAEAPLPSRSSALRVLTNEPGAEVKIRIRFNLFRAETMTGFTEITFLNVRDRANFRWALIGTGSMRFRARMIPVTNGNPQATFDALPDFQDAYVDTAPTSWTPADIRDCPRDAELNKKIGLKDLGAVSAIFGGLGQARLVASNGWDSTVADGVTIQLIFLEVVPETTLIASTWRTGRIGDQAIDFSTGTLNFHRSECLSVYGQELRSTDKKPSITATLYSKEASKQIAIADPPSNSNVHGDWSRSEPFTIMARFEDQKWKSIRDAMIFLAGVIGGLFAGLLVAGFQAREGD